MNNHHAILTDAFSLLAIAASVATFLPAMIYLHLMKFADELEKKGDDKDFKFDSSKEDDNNRKWVDNLVSFSASIDIIQFTMMIVVVFTAICNFILYIYSLNTKNWLIVCIIIFWLLFLISIGLLWRESFRYLDKYKEYWNGKPFVNVLYSIIILYVLFELVASIGLYICKTEVNNRVNIEVCMVSISTIILLITILIWMFPLLKYRPIGKKIEDALRKIKDRSKRRESDYINRNKSN